MKPDPTQYHFGKTEIWRSIRMGYRVIAGMLVPSGIRIERLANDIWIYKDTIPPDEECVQSLIRNSLK